MIESLSLSGIRNRLSGTILNHDVDFHSVSTDTRNIKPADLFVALKGPNFNGNLFVSEAAQKGACGAVVSESVTSELPMLKVVDTTEALGKLAQINREKFQGKILAVTGSNGKTTVKGMLASILALSGETLATSGNLNNHIGVPLTLLKISKAHCFAVLELGASAIGEIKYTASLVKPHVAVITNASEAHVEGFGSLQNIISAKGELFENMDDKGIAVINLDSNGHRYWLDITKASQRLTFSVNAYAGSDFYVKQLQLSEQGCSSFYLVSPAGEISVHLAVMGKHNVANALAAAAAAYAAGMELTAIKKGLENFQNITGRLEKKQHHSKAIIIDDTYNASPASLKAAIDTLAAYPKRKILVLGDMAELGKQSETAHHEAGEYAQQKGVNILLTLGKLSAFAVNGFIENIKGMNSYARHFGDQDELVAHLIRVLDKDTVALVKGSRSSHMEKIVQAIVADTET